MDQREVRGLDQIGLYKRKQIGLEQQDWIRQSISDEIKKSREENSSLWKFMEG